MSLSRQRVAALAQVCIVLICWGCTSPSVDGTLEPPYDSYTGSQGREYWVYLDESVALEHLVDLSTFSDAGIRVGMNVDEVTEILGPPVQQYNIHPSLIAYVFETPRGPIEVIKSISDSEGVRGESFFLRTPIPCWTNTYPLDQLVEILEGTEADSDISLLSKEGKVKLELEGFRIAYTWWMSDRPFKVQSSSSSEDTD